MGSLLRKLGLYTSIIPAKVKWRALMHKAVYTGYVAGNTYHITSVKRGK